MRKKGDWEHKRVEVELDDHVQNTSQSQAQEHTQGNESERSEDKRDASFKNS